MRLNREDFHDIVADLGIDAAYDEVSRRYDTDIKETTKAALKTKPKVNPIVALWNGFWNTVGNIWSGFWDWFWSTGIIIVIICGFIALVWWGVTSDTRDFRTNTAICKKGDTVGCMDAVKEDTNPDNEKFYRRVYKLQTGKDLPSVGDD